MTEAIDLTPEQNEFLELACAFLHTKPSQQELDKLFTLVSLLLPEPVVELLRERVVGNGAFWDAFQPGRRLQ